MSPTHTGPPDPRPHLGAVSVYSPGRTAEAAMEDHGLTDAVKLASNEVPFGPLPGVAEALAASATATSRYADHSADLVARDFAEMHAITRDEVAVGPGSVGLLQQVTLAFAGPDDEVLYPWPSFVAYPQFSGIVAAKQITVGLRRCSIDVDALLAAITAHTRVIFLANPNNPTSTAVRSHDLHRLIAGVPPDCLLVIDEAYREFVTSTDVPDALDFVRLHPNVVVLRTLSKAYGMAGMRVGFMVGHPRVVAAVNATLIPFAVNGPAQAAARVALRQGDEVARRCAIITAERRRVERALRHDDGLGLPTAQGNFWWLPSGSQSAHLALELERRGVVVRPFPDGLRVTVGTVDENERFLGAFRAALVADPSLTDGWRLPTGDVTVAAGSSIDRLDAAIARLNAQAAGRARGVDAWRRSCAAIATATDEACALVDSAPAGRDAPFDVESSLTSDDVDVSAPTPAAGASGAADDIAGVARAVDRLGALLAEMSGDEWETSISHPHRGRMRIGDIVDTFVIDPLERLAADPEGDGSHR